VFGEIEIAGMGRSIDGVSRSTAGVGENSLTIIDRLRATASVFGSQRLIPKSGDSHIARWVRRKSVKLRLVERSAGRSSGVVWRKGGA
jgi:hypothetical protein